MAPAQSSKAPSDKSSTASSVSTKPNTVPTKPKHRTPTSIRELSMTDYKPAAASLAASFAHDDVARYFLDTPARTSWSEEQKYALHTSIMEYIVAQHILRGIVTAAGPASDPYACIALWMPPGEDGDDFTCLLRSGMWRLHYKLDPEARVRMFKEFFPLLHDTKTDVMGSRDADSYYLVYIGTKPGAQGLGLARKTIEYITSRADEEGRACYLESSNDANPAIYRRLGFEVVKKIALKRGPEDVELDIMVREPVDGGVESLPSSTDSSLAGDGDVSVMQQLTGTKMPVLKDMAERGLERVRAATGNKVSDQTASEVRTFGVVG